MTESKLEPRSFEQRYVATMYTNLRRLGYSPSHVKKVRDSIDLILGQTSHPDIAVGIKSDLAFRILPSLRSPFDTVPALTDYFEKLRTRKTFDGTPAFDPNNPDLIVSKDHKTIGAMF